MKRYIGCSGWNYKEWRGKFYPEKLPQRLWLDYYMEVFNTVEVNNTFYRFPRESTLEKWKEKAGKDFYYTLKGSRYVTQMKKLRDVQESVTQFEEVAGVMGSRLRCILWQLPGSLHRDDNRLDDFCRMLHKGATHVIEFRHKSWFDKGVYDILSDHGVSFCTVSAPGLPDDLVVTNQTGYVRFHGSGTNWYEYDYSREELEAWHQRIMDCGAKEVYVYFNNDIGAYAPGNAELLREIDLSYR